MPTHEQKGTSDMWPGTTSSPTQHVVSHPSLGKQQVLFVEVFVGEGFNTGL